MPMPKNKARQVKTAVEREAEVTGLRQKLLQALPPFFTRQTAAKMLGGLISPGTLANLDSEGQGPPVKVKLGRKVAYERSAFVDWFLSRS